MGVMVGLVLSNKEEPSLMDEVWSAMVHSSV
jgi:hypothetical protein